MGRIDAYVLRGVLRTSDTSPAKEHMLAWTVRASSSAQNWMAKPRLWLIWLAGGGVTENRMPKSLNVKSSV